MKFEKHSSSNKYQSHSKKADVLEAVTQVCA